MAERLGSVSFAPGDRVRTRRTDPPHHTRLPRYVRGATGTVVELQGSHPLPDDRARGLRADPEPVYTVRFAARDLFGEGEHVVTVDLWQSYLEEAI
ncbi:MAG TPA: SH3-like domain-containing protein [Streptosporangiaceae bacterium]|nr:SH3-like domain-containing protein [Streptosporangiaceae bacterium]